MYFFVNQNAVIIQRQVCYVYTSPSVTPLRWVITFVCDETMDETQSETRICCAHVVSLRVQRRRRIPPEAQTPNSYDPCYDHAAMTLSSWLSYPGARKDCAGILPAAGGFVQNADPQQPRLYTTPRPWAATKHAASRRISNLEKTTRQEPASTRC